MRLRLTGLAVLASLLALASAALAAPPAPRISGTTLDGKRLSISALQGRPVLVNVWSSW
jgi:hypothetical protein